MIHLHLRLPDGNKMGRVAEAVPQIGAKLTLDLPPERTHVNRSLHSFRVKDVEHVVTERSRHAKVIVTLENLPEVCERCGIEYGVTAHGPGFCLDRRTNLGKAVEAIEGLSGGA